VGGCRRRQGKAQKCGGERRASGEFDQHDIPFLSKRHEIDP
jgi:hypothetical protein